jgi:membrane-bound serine protease (ClpP class)
VRVYHAAWPLRPWTIGDPRAATAGSPGAAERREAGPARRVHAPWGMRALIAVLGTAILASQAATPEPPAPGPPAGRAACVVRVDLGLIITAGTSEYVAAGLGAAEARGCALLVVLDTPGGELEATRRIVQAFLGARAPVVVYVAPSGGRAGSAGMFITIAAHLAAMAPGTSIGSAHPVSGLGRDPEEAGGEHLGRKVEEDAAALARAIAQRRDRNVAWAEAAVRTSVSATAAEAHAARVVDLIAASEAELLATIDGLIVETAAGPIALATRGAPVSEHRMTLSQRVRSVLGNPGLVYLLFMIGVIGLVIELSNPGLIVPGAIGGVALVLAALGINALPVQVGSVVLLVLGAALLAAEVFVTSYGLLALAGVALLALGAALLVDHDAAEVFADASLGVSWGLILPMVVLAGGVAIALALRAGRVRRLAAVTGLEAMRGHRGRVEIAITDRPGQVVVDGEHWRAVADAAIPAGTEVRIDEVHGLTVHVTPVPAPAGRIR